MLRFALLQSLTLPLLGTVTAPARAADVKEPATPSYVKDVVPVLNKYCVSCHGGMKPRGKIALDTLKDQSAALKKPKVWEKVAENLRSGDMPPADSKQPTAEERNTINAWIDAEIFKVTCSGLRDPGRVTIRRLNRVEYNNTIRDLLGVDFHPADDFPSDDSGYGFDNIGDVLSLPPLLMEKYLAAAEKITEKVFQDASAKKRLLNPPVIETFKRAKPEGSRSAALRTIAGRAFRRPATEDEVRRLGGLIQLAQRNGEADDKALQLALQAVLVSPHFLFRIEKDRESKRPDGAYAIGDFELATRLSYFLWASMPDDELFRAAGDGALRKPEVLEAQVRRMLKDPKARALSQNFAPQWLQIRGLRTFTPDPKMFPSFDEPLRNAMFQETERFFQFIVNQDRSVLELIDSDYTFVDERLARHYGIKEVKGPEVRKVKLPDSRRGGVLAMASVLTVTSNPTRTSPVKRGKWILENLLGTPPPPPPPMVEELKDDANAVLSGSLRQRMEQHRANPSCAVCHQKLDPLGFGFENFNVIGGWRDKEGKFAIDASGVLPDGKKFNGPAELRKILLAREADFCRCLTEKLMTYGLGRGMEPSDRCTIEEIARNLSRHRYRFQSLVLDIVKSDAFQMRRPKQMTR